jgi:hypothetical protein
LKVPEKEETVHYEFARATMTEKFTRYQAEARKPRIKLPILRRRKAGRTGKVGALRPTASG